MSIVKQTKDKNDKDVKIIFTNNDISETIQDQASDIVKTADAPYEALVLKFGKQNVFFNPALNSYFLFMKKEESE